ncbi:MAG: hypothetical protein IJX98_03350 [Clostridia bacterium]|nr:hypothetical protein [Clostridia bacterium]
MRGLKTQESTKFKNFFSIVQKAARRRNAIFFLEAGDGRELQTELFEGEDLQGWLIPEDKVDDFEKSWKEGKIEEKWEEFFCFAVWNKNQDNITIKFE